MCGIPSLSSCFIFNKNIRSGQKDSLDTEKRKESKGGTTREAVDEGEEEKERESTKLYFVQNTIR